VDIHWFCQHWHEDEERIARGLGVCSLDGAGEGVGAETPDLDDIPEMEGDDLEEGWF